MTIMKIRDRLTASVIGRPSEWLDRWRGNGMPEDLAGATGPAGRRAAAAFAASLRFENVSKSYGSFRVLRDFSLDVAAGETVCLLGPSGCGKSTLLRLASGIERPTSGRIYLNDRVVAGPEQFVEPERRNVGLMFQDFALFPHLTILENVAFGLRELDRQTAAREAFAALTRVGLDRYARDYPHILSGGQQQRVALARALVPRPSVILMDEPFSGLDVHLREIIRAETQTLLKETRSTCLLVTHDPEEAMQLGDRVAVMRDGRIVQVGDAKSLYHHPVDLFAARLFSEINEISSRVSNGFVETPFGRYEAVGYNDGDHVVLCVRQRAVRVFDVAAKGEGRVHGRVLATRFKGDLVLLSIGVDGLESPLHSLVRGENAPAVGADVRVSVNASGTMIFAPESKV